MIWEIVHVNQDFTKWYILKLNQRFSINVKPVPLVKQVLKVLRT